MLVLLLLATTAITAAGALCVATAAEPDSVGRRALAFLVLAPAQVTVIVVASGAVGVFRPGPVTALALAIAAAEWRWYVRSLATAPSRTLRACGAEALWAGVDHPLLAGLTALCGLAVAWQAVAAVRLPVLGYDALLYHLLGPTTWVQTGHLQASNLSSFSDGYPQGQEVLHAWTMVFLHSTRGTAVVGIWALALGAAAVAVLTRRATSRVGAVLAAVVFVSFPVVLLQTATAYVDVAAGASVLATLTFLLDWRARAADVGPFRGRAATTLLLAATSAGLAVGIKASNLLVVPIAIAFVVFVVVRLEDRRSRLPANPREWLVVAGSLLVLLLGGIWYLRNLSVHHNPFWPVSTFGLPGHGTFAQVVSGTQAPPELAGRNPVVQLGRSLLEDLRLPHYEYDQRLGGFGLAWLLACVPALGWLAVRTGRRDPAGVVLAATMSIGAVVASHTIWWTRFAIALAGLGCVALGVAVDQLRRSPATGTGRTLAQAAQLGVGACVVLSLFATIHPYQHVIDDSDAISITSLAKIVVRGDGRSRLWPWGDYRGLDALPHGARIGLIDGQAGWSPQLLMGEGLDRRLVTLDPPTSVDDLRRVMERADVDYLYLPYPRRPSSLEAVAVGDPSHFRPAAIDPQLPGATLYQLGGFRNCAETTVDVLVAGTRTGDVVGGVAQDGCGPAAGTRVELWQAGPDLSRPQEGATMIERAAPSNQKGGFELQLRRGILERGHSYFVIQPSRSLRATYHPRGASFVFEAPR